MQNPPEPEEHYEWGGYDDEEEDDPYAGFVTPLVALFDRAQAAFDYGNMQLAHDAYAALFECLDQQDDYGRGIMPSDLSGVDIWRLGHVTCVWSTRLSRLRIAPP